MYRLDHQTAFRKNGSETFPDKQSHIQGIEELTPFHKQAPAQQGPPSSRPAVAASACLFFTLPPLFSSFLNFFLNTLPIRYQLCVINAHAGSKTWSMETFVAPARDRPVKPHYRLNRKRRHLWKPTSSESIAANRGRSANSQALWRSPDALK